MGVSVRRVTCLDPETLTIYDYLTNLPVSTAPGIVALPYSSGRTRQPVSIKSTSAHEPYFEHR
jgi:hypothetical protein